MAQQPQPQPNNTSGISISPTEWEAALASERVRQLARYVLASVESAKERFEWALAQAQAHSSQPFPNPPTKPPRHVGSRLSLAEFYAAKHLVANPWLLDQPLPIQSGSHTISTGISRINQVRNEVK